MIYIPVEGQCEPCGGEAMDSDGFICDTCASLQELRASEKQKELDCAGSAAHHLKLSTTTVGWEQSAQLALVTRYEAEARFHYCKYRAAKEKLDAREVAFTDRLEAEQRGAA